MRVNTTTGELDIAFRVVATATHDGTTLTSHSAVTLTVTDADDAPTGFRFQNPVASLAETSDTSNAIRLAALRVDYPDTNPAFRDHSFTLSGVDRALFEVWDGALYLKAGVELDAATDANFTTDDFNGDLVTTVEVL